MQDIKALLRETREIETCYLEILKEEVKNIKEKNIKDISYIENILDTIMSICFVDTHSLFSELCNYYDGINEDNSNEYRLIYRNICKND